MRDAPQKIFRIRRDYNSWVANETLEDFALRYTPRSFRKWSEARVANTALGATSFLALEAIGAAIAIHYGFANALWAIVVVALVTFLTALPISFYAARYGVDMDLLTRGAGFGYLGSTITSLVYASFTFIFFALEAAILGSALQTLLEWPLWWCYLLASLCVIPIVMHGITLISRIQAWTQPVWIILLLLPFAAVALKAPANFEAFTHMAGLTSGGSNFEAVMFGAAASVAFSLVVQVGEQVDYLRFLPERTRENRMRWWAAVITAGPGWIIPGALKMMGGAFLAFLATRAHGSAAQAVDPTHMYLAGFEFVFSDPRWAMAVTVLFVIVSQVKINVTNAYAGSLAWSNFFARLTHSHPGRVVWLVFNVLIAVMLMALDVFDALESVLALYGNVAIAWVGALVADLVINKPLGLSPHHIEFKRAHLYDLNPVGLGAMLLACLASGLAFSGLLGPAPRAFSPVVALVTSMGSAPVLAYLTRGRWYLARPAQAPWSPGESVRCSVCENSFEAEDMAVCPAYDAPICSLCCTLESRCHDGCKSDSRATDQVRALLSRVLPAKISRRVNFRVAHYVLLTTALIGLLGLIMGLVYTQQSAVTASDLGGLRSAFLTVFALLGVAAAVGAWWMVLGSESRQMAEDESTRQNVLLRQEIEAHRRTDQALKTAKEQAETANQAKTRYVAGITHELRTPLNSILGYAQILLKDESVIGSNRRAVSTIFQSGEHMLALVDGLLDLARIEAGRVRLDIAPLATQAFLDDIVHMVAPQAQARGLAFELKTLGRVPRYVRADARRLRQTLINLLANAVRFTEQGGVTLRADFTREVARFDVIDSGIGIAPQDLERIFMPFERGSAGRRSGDQGTGLGLTITHLLTQLMGGEVTVSSTVGRGSTFSVRLYLPETSDAPTPTQGAYRPVTGYIGERLRLLVVDDQPIQRQLLAGMLLPLGFRIEEAASGSECLELLQHGQPDAILLDLTMDDMDGWETARRIRASGRLSVPIIIVSANAFENQAEHLAAAGCQEFVDKPVVESDLLAALQRHLQIEWVADLPSANWSPVPEPTAAALRVPSRNARAIARFARLGHRQAVLTALDALAEEMPQAMATIETIRTLAERFAWRDIENLLTPSIEADEEEGP